MNTASQLLATAEDQPIVVVGRPRALRTALAFANLGAASIVVRGAKVRLNRATDAAAPAVRASLVAVLPPGLAMSAVLRLSVDPETPPGTYRGVIEVAGATRLLELTIVEDLRVGIEPSPVILDRSAGPRLRKPVTFRNQGNVPLHIDVPSPVPIGAELPLVAVAQAKVVASGDVGQAITELFGKLFQNWQEFVVEEIGEMKLRLLGGGFDLAPGESRSAELECILPDELAPQRRYHARAPVYDQDLALVVVTASSGGAQRRRARSIRAGRKALSDI
jgi:hypothetical protein